MLDLVLKNTTLPDGRVADLSFSEGKLTHIGSAGAASEEIDCRGLLCIPAACDMHVHMRGGSQSAKETWRTGTMAALAGGVTMVVDQPNTIPPLLTETLYHDRILEAKAGSLCSFGINGGVSPGADLHALFRAGALAFGEIFAAPSSYGEALTDHQLRDALFAINSLGGLATIHAEEVLEGIPETLGAHHRIRSPDGEVRSLDAISDCLPPGMKPHICHLSSPDSLASAPGSKEVTPHHLFLSIERFSPDDTHARVNPPLRPESIRRRLYAAWDQIDVIASDHAPHTISDKAVPFADAPSGLPGVETMLPLLMNEVAEKRLSLASVIEKTAISPCRILGIQPAGFTRDTRADFALYAMKPETIEGELLHSRCGWTPYEGMPGVFPTLVIQEGAVSYSGGEFTGTSGRWVPGRGYHGLQHID